MSKVVITYDALCKHCTFLQRNGRGKPITCKKGKTLIKGAKSKICEEFKLN